MNTSGFYKNDDGFLLHGPNQVLNLNYELNREEKNSYLYPIDGWYWFDSEEEAKSFFKLDIPLIEESDLNGRNL